MTATVESQRIEALRYANEVRLERARIRRTVGSLARVDGCHLVASYISNPPPCLLSARVEQVLAWPRRCGRQKAVRVLIAARVPDTFTVGRLTEAQRARLAEALTGDFGGRA